MDMLTEDPDLSSDTVRDAVNGIFDEEGHWQRRDGFFQANPSNTLHSLWSAPHDSAFAYGCDGTSLCTVTTLELDVTFTPIFTMPTADPVSFCWHNASTYFTSRAFLGRIAGGVVSEIGVPDAAAPAVATAAVGDLEPGKYGVAMSYVSASGEEGGLSRMRTLTVGAGQGIRATMSVAPPGAAFVRLYRTDANGDMLRRASEFPAAVATTTIGAGNVGREADTQFLRRMPAGDIVRGWRGFLLVARGRYLYRSKALRHGLHDPRFDFHQFPTKITFLEAIDGGVFVGQRDGVIFLAGEDPRSWKQARPAGRVPVPGASAVIPASMLEQRLQLSGEVAVWLAENGYVLGTPSGQLIELQTNRIRLPVAAAGCLAVHDRRLTTIVN